MINYNNNNNSSNSNISSHVYSHYNNTAINGKATPLINTTFFNSNFNSKPAINIFTSSSSSSNSSNNTNNNISTFLSYLLVNNRYLYNHYVSYLQSKRSPFYIYFLNSISLVLFLFRANINL